METKSYFDMPKDEPSPARSLLLPMSIGAALLVLGLEQPATWAVAATIPFVALFVLSVPWARQSAAAFDRDAIGLLARGEGAGLPGRYHAAWGLRLFGTLGMRLERRGRVALELGQLGEAARCYGRLVKMYRRLDDLPLQTLLGHAHARYGIGQYDEAVNAYRAVVRVGGPIPLSHALLAHALFRRGALEEAREAVRVAKEEGPGEIETLALCALEALLEGEADMVTRILEELPEKRNDASMESLLLERLRKDLEEAAEEGKG